MGVEVCAVGIADEHVVMFSHDAVQALANGVVESGERPRASDRFQVLTKRADRLEELSAELEWPSNVWMGTSVEQDRYRSRTDHLRATGARVKFLSLEPLLGPLNDLDLHGID